MFAFMHDPQLYQPCGYREEEYGLMRLRACMHSGGEQCSVVERKWILDLVTLCLKFWFYIIHRLVLSIWASIVKWGL